MNHQDEDNAANFEERNSFPGYPIYPPVDDTFNKGTTDDTDPEDFFKWKEPNWITGEWRTILPKSESAAGNFNIPYSEMVDYNTHTGEENYM